MYNPFPASGIGQLPVIALCGKKNSGKTYFLEKLIPILKDNGLSPALVKHDGHDFQPDVPFTDSWKLRAAGASIVAVFSPKRMTISYDKPNLTISELFPYFQGADFVLLEGGKNSPYPKAEIIRGPNNSGPLGLAGTHIALITDGPLRIPGVPTLALDDYAGLAKIISSYLAKFATLNNI
jgi:molybdopterin-guanine dinucleotide biosynthesis protein B